MSERSERATITAERSERPTNKAESSLVSSPSAGEVMA